MGFTPNLMVIPIFDYGEDGERVLKANDVNAGKFVWLANGSGGDLTTGQIGFIDTDGTVHTTTSAGLRRTIVVVADMATGVQTIPDGQYGWFVVAGQTIVKTSEAVGKGEWARTSTVAGSAQGETATSAPPQGTFGIFLTGGDEGANVPCFIVQGLGWSDEAHVAATKGVHGLEAETELVGCKEGTSRIEAGTDVFPAQAQTTQVHTITFATAFGATPAVAIAPYYSCLSGTDVKGCTLRVESVSTTGFVLRYTNDNTEPYSCTAWWIAVGAQ